MTTLHCMSFLDATQNDTTRHDTTRFKNKIESIDKKASFLSVQLNPVIGVAFTRAKGDLKKVMRSLYP